MDDYCQSTQECPHFRLEDEDYEITCSICRARSLYNANYRKVGKDEIVVKKSEYEKLRLAKYKAMEEAIEYEKTAYKQLEQAKQETAREILITIHNNLKYATIKQTGTLISVKSLANELGIDLE